MKTNLPVLEFRNCHHLRDWLIDNHDVSNGIFVKIYKKKSGIDSVSFEEVLEEGLCFGWSESLRLKGDEQSYLQKFTPRKTSGTTSERNRLLAARLIKENRMRPVGLAALGLG
ncbi:hypothetical protein KC945_01995 [Candidatus Saccharibacteria bacterium]|nr:hypothetical protein [Candidatus Saccharibacteria bacterium]